MSLATRSRGTRNTRNTRAASQAGRSTRRCSFTRDPARRWIILPQFDAFVVIGQDQGCPNALLEALAAGLPCIANDDGGTGDQIIDERTGMLVHDREPATIARAIVRVLADRPLAERLGRAGREHALRSFSLQTMVSRYDALFASLAARARSGNKERTE